MVYIPGFLINKVYEKGSLRNTKNGFEFSFRNRMTPLRISGMRGLSLEIDGVRYPAERITLELGGRPMSLAEGRIEGMYLFDKDSKLLIRVNGGALEKGSRVVKISFITNEYGGATLKVSDTIGASDHPALKQILEIIEWIISREQAARGRRPGIGWDFPALNYIRTRIRKRIGDGERERARGPLRIAGELGGVPLDPDFSRLEAALRREEPDRVPLFEAEIALPIQEWFLGREINDARDEIEFYIRAGYDFVPVVPPFFAPRLMHEAAARDGDGRTWLTESEGLIRTVKDVESFPWPQARDVDFSTFEEIAALLPAKMKIIGMLSPAAVFGNTSQAMGLQNFSLALFDNPAVVQALFELIGATYVEIAKRLVKMPRLGAVFMSDDLAYTEGLLVSPAVYRKHVFPWYKKIGEILDRAGLPFIFHSDGNIIPVLDDLAACGICAIHPIEPQAMEIADVKKRFGNRFCIFGNIDLEYTLTRGTVQDVVELVKKRIRELGPGGGYGLAASNSVPDYVKPENYRAMVETAIKYGKYPIAL